jgi:hypothetical protein
MPIHTSDTPLDIWSKKQFLGCPYYFAFSSAFAHKFELGDVLKDAEIFSIQN